MPENFEHPKTTLNEQSSKEIEGGVEIKRGTETGKVFWNLVLKQIERHRKASESGGSRINQLLVKAIAEINPKMALKLVRSEERVLIEDLAIIASSSKSLETGLSPSILADIEARANATEAKSVDGYKNASHWPEGFPYTSSEIGETAVLLRSIAPELSDRLINTAIERKRSGDKIYPRGSLYNSRSSWYPLIEHIASIDPLKADELLQEFKVTFIGPSAPNPEIDYKPISSTIDKYLENNDFERAFRLALDRGSARHVIVTASKIAENSPEEVILNVGNRQCSKIEKVSIFSGIAQTLFKNGLVEPAEKLLDEAQKITESLPPMKQGDSLFDDKRDSINLIIPVIAIKDPKKSLQMVGEVWNDENDKYNTRRPQTINAIAANAAYHNPQEALAIYQQTPDDSLGKMRALLEIFFNTAKSSRNESAGKLLQEIRRLTSQRYDNKFLIHDVERIAKLFPQDALEILKDRQCWTYGKGDSASQKLTPKDVEPVLSIIERVSLSPEDQEILIDELAESSGMWQKDKSVLRSAFVDRIAEKNSEDISSAGLVGYFYSLNPERSEDIEAVQYLASSGLSSQSKVKDLLETKNSEALELLPLAIVTEIYKKTDFDLDTFNALISLAETESLKRAVLHAIKLLKPKIAELFYSSNQQYQDTFKKLYGLSPEAQQWFGDLDTYIAENFDTQNLIRLVTKLGSPEANQMFPQAMEKAREEILAHIQSNEDLADYYLENLHLYKDQLWASQGLEGAIKHYPVAQKFIKAVDAGTAAWKDAPYIVAVFAKAKLTKLYDEEEWDEERGAESQGFSEIDPYENHHWKFTGEQIKMASALADVIAGKVDEEIIKQLGISQESLKTLRTVEQQLNTVYENFLSEIESSSTFPEEDKIALLHPENSSVRMTDLRGNIRSFVARYLTQMAEGDIAKLNKELEDISENLEGILQEGLRRFIKIYEVDVPLYDKLYEEFDNLRETGQFPLEVYLGRDGIYAWLGRRAQDVARRRKLGLEGRKQAKEAGEVIAIQPKYLIYPRYFRDSINYETKREFLEQEGISPDADPMFYDTGYTGTIPEQIMRVMDFENEEIERRIRLLSAPVVHRRVKGIPENARTEIIEYIEHNAKTENTAVGLIKDPETGKIRPIAEPTAPDEQFYFMMVKQAVGRHYWLKEQLHHEPSGNINLDSEHYLIRVRQEYSSLLPPEFVNDPKKYLAQQGELLKGSKGEGEYPDEEVVLFKLSDDTEIVAKRVELRKAKEARKEFSILIAARKANLPTAEPVGFLSGKTEADSSYLLMKKIEGFSGRKFEKHLRDSGKYNDDQVKEIMQTVAEKNREVAELFRETLNIDKRWRIKDTIVEFDEETGEVAGVTPIDWERVRSYDPSSPKEIDEIE